MQVRLEAINFNHDPTSAHMDAYNIRKNETTPIAQIEWQRGQSTKPEDSLAAYSLSDTEEGKVLTIKARFSISDTTTDPVFIRAVDGGSSLSCKSVLGEVAETKVEFTNGDSGFITMELKGPAIWSVGVGVHDIVWLWQFRTDPSASWSDFDHSFHRIYTTLSLPKDPWVQEPFDPSNTQLVWTDVLDHACTWAKGVGSDADEAAAAIVRAVFDLGPQFIQFDNQNNGASHYSDNNNFDCTAFLRRLEGEQSNGRFVNCTDCASVVSTFANAIGCDLSQARMAPPPGTLAFPLNPHKRIGFPTLVAGRSFRYHEVAWKGACTEADDVFDACLLINRNITAGSFVSKSASNLPFGALGERHYRFRLVPQAGQSNCIPVAGSAVRRKPGPVPQTLRIGGVGVAPPPPPNNFIRGFSFSGFESGDFNMTRVRSINANNGIPVIQSFWKDQDQNSSLIRIDTYECASVNDARTGALHLLDDFELPGVEGSNNSSDTILKFENSENSTVLFTTANMVFLMRNVGSEASPLSKFASSLQQYLLPPTEVTAVGHENVISRFRIDEEAIAGGKLEIRKSTAEEGYCWFSSELGEVSREGNKLFYEPASAGEHTINIWTLEAGGVISFECIQLRVL